MEKIIELCDGCGDEIDEAFAHFITDGDVLCPECYGQWIYEMNNDLSGDRI